MPHRPYPSPRSPAISPLPAVTQVACGPHRSPHPPAFWPLEFPAPMPADRETELCPPQGAAVAPHSRAKTALALKIGNPPPFPHPEPPHLVFFSKGTRDSVGAGAALTRPARRHFRPEREAGEARGNRGARARVHRGVQPLSREPSTHQVQLLPTILGIQLLKFPLGRGRHGRWSERSLCRRRGSGPRTIRGACWHCGACALRAPPRLHAESDRLRGKYLERMTSARRMARRRVRWRGGALAGGVVQRAPRWVGAEPRGPPHPRGSSSRSLGRSRPARWTREKWPQGGCGVHEVHMNGAGQENPLKPSFLLSRYFILNTTYLS